MIAQRSWSRQRRAIFRYCGETPSSLKPARRTSAIDAALAGYRLGSYAVVRQSSNSFDWTDATVGGAVVFGFVLIGGGVAVGARRLRGERLTPA